MKFIAKPLFEKGEIEDDVNKEFTVKVYEVEW